MSNLFYLASKSRYLVTGLNLENFLFNLTSSGICVSGVKRKKNTLSFCASTVNNKVIIGIARNLGLSIKQVGQTGLIKIIKSLPYCIGAILGIIYSVFCVQHFTNYISVIDYVLEPNHMCTNHDFCIYKEDNLNKIKNYIAGYIQVGKKYTANTQDVQNGVVANFNLVENCAIKKDGFRVTIQLFEAVGKQAGLNTQIIATNNCVIASINTYSGKALVKAGDVVTKGQVLVESVGEVLPRANIIAKVWYTGMALHNCNQMVLKETGKTFTTTSIQVFGKTLLKHKSSPFKYYSSKTNSSYITNMLLPIKKVSQTFFELELVQEYIAFNTVKANVLAKSKQDALSKTKGTPIECTYSVVSQNNTVRVDCFLLVEEQLGTIN